MGPQAALHRYSGSHSGSQNSNKMTVILRQELPGQSTDPSQFVATEGKMRGERLLVHTGALPA